MVVFGLVAIDHAVAIAELQIASSTRTPESLPSFGRIVFSYFSNRPMNDDIDFLQGLNQAVDVVSQKSQSMYIGSAMFQGGLRTDLLLL